MQNMIAHTVHTSSWISTDQISHRGYGADSTWQVITNYSPLIRASATLLKKQKKRICELLKLGPLCKTIRVTGPWKRRSGGQSVEIGHQTGIHSSTRGPASSHWINLPVSHTIWPQHLDPGRETFGRWERIVGLCVSARQAKSEVVCPPWLPAPSLGRLHLGGAGQAVLPSFTLSQSRGEPSIVENKPAHTNAHWHTQSIGLPTPWAAYLGFKLARVPEFFNISVPKKYKKKKNLPFFPKHCRLE